LPPSRECRLSASIQLPRQHCVLFARTWAVELKDRKLRVNVISRGTIVTPGYQSAALDDEQIEKIEAQAAAAAPLGRVGTTDEIAKATITLAPMIAIWCERKLSFSPTDS
jgi:NAD(P)-dependent dehydrogenase (short-subunit alcohol dehydrogenase family)